MGRFDDDDATRLRPAGGDLDETRIRPAGTSDGTRMLPPVDDGPAGDERPRWEARASVPPPGTRPTIGYPDYEDPAPPPDDRNWLRPLLFGVIGLVLLGVLLTGVWLIFTADDEPPAPQASAPATVPATTTSPPRAATSAPPSTAEPETVKVPDDLIGIDEDEARQKLTDAGLRVQVSRREDATMAPGTVIEVEPEPGSDVEPNSVVRIVVASAPKPSASASRSRGDDGNG